MTGDRLKALEEGFLEGSLSEAEEAALRSWVKDHPEHRLSPYFRWTSADEAIEVPDFRSKMSLEEKEKNWLWLKVAAAILALVVFSFLLKDQVWEKPKEIQFTKSEIDESYQATLETLSAMAVFLDKGISDTQQACKIAEPFEKLNELKESNETDQ